MHVAQSIAAASRQAGQDDPVVRGADWQTAVVTAVNTDGTVSIGPIRARCLDTYQGPAVGDQIVISQNGIRTWLAHGRLAGTTRAWTTLPLASGWSQLSPYYLPTYRIWSDGTASLSGLASMSGSLASGTTVATLPAEARPASQVRYTVQINTGTFGVMTLFPNGNIQLGDFSATLPSTGQKWAQYDVASHYRLA
jgi:hypothetical protein